MATIAEEISALRERISQAYDVIDQKGGDVPFDRTSWNLSASIDSIRVEGEADPAAIVPVRYLKSTGTQYIDTGAYFTSQNSVNEARVECDFQYEAPLSGTQRIYGVINSSNSLTYQCGINGGADPKLYVGWGASNPINGFPADTLRHKVVLDTRNNQIWLDGQLSSFTYISYTTITGRVYLFARNTNNSASLFSNGRVYRYRHLQNENIMRDLIPARIGTEGVMYDVNTGEIFHNQGTGDFEYGLDSIPVLRDAVQVEYMDFSGTQGFDTGIYGNQDTQVEITLYNQNPTGTQFIFGSRQEYTQRNFSLLMSETAWVLDICNGGTESRWAPAYSTFDKGWRTNVQLAMKRKMLLHESEGLKVIQRTPSNSMTFTTPTTIRIGLIPDSTAYPTQGNFTGRFYKMRIWDGTTLVRDFVPCRIGTTGYLYDRVSQTLFGNIGTGEFVLGPDVG